ncbi:YacP-like NYN domain protein [bacterium BMS3Bbin06]|nr:YacP-like NYN domain protein [bacterium BMS3Bbin06]
MALLIIDGYNVIGIHHRDLDARRKALIRMLIDYRRIRGHSITLVFDGHGGFSARENVKSEGGIRIIYSRISRKADDVIKEIIKKAEGSFIVVSSDREIADYAWGHGSVPVSSDDFLDKLEVVSGDEGAGGGVPEEMDAVEEKFIMDESPEMEGSSGRRIKGRAYTPTKRQKAVRRALKKL